MLAHSSFHSINYLLVVTDLSSTNPQRLRFGVSSSLLHSKKCYFFKEIFLGFKFWALSDFTFNICCRSICWVCKKCCLRSKQRKPWSQAPTWLNMMTGMKRCQMSLVWGSKAFSGMVVLSMMPGSAVHPIK